MFHPLDPTGGRSQPVGQWFLIAGSSGFVNAGAFLSVGVFATHITGFATLFGVNTARGNLGSAWTALFVPAFFLLGSFLGGCWVDVRLSTRQLPRFDWAMGLAGVALFTVALLGSLDVLGTFGQRLALNDHSILLSLLCFSSGLQNAAMTSSSGEAVRVSHMTGLTTDIGRGLARLAFRTADTKERLKTVTRIGTVASFVVGSVLGAYSFLSLGFLGFGLPGLVCFYAAIEGHRAKRHYTANSTSAP